MSGDARGMRLNMNAVRSSLATRLLPARYGEGGTLYGRPSVRISAVRMVGQ